ncbi:MAG: L-seryl-tRNA(Sec) selenium transferase [bacterium]|nr:L-seryl-tRNA(Sec) selenium transferase [bacterium]
MSVSRQEMARALQAIPSVDRLLGSAPFKTLAEQWRREGLRHYLQIRLDEYRQALRDGSQPPLSRDRLLTTLPKVWAEEWVLLVKHGTRRVINGTGVLLHTNLGRSVLPPAALKAVTTAARWPVDVELDLGTGKRAPRTRKLELLLRILTGTEAAFAVNNNAAALTLAVDTLARKRRLIVSRGEQVEIGGSFRLPEILERFAGRMVEVGTTNRTRIVDYEKGITRKGDVLLKVHRSNFSQEGYVLDTTLEELTALGRRKNCPVIYDLGSGRFDDGMEWLAEPTLAEGLAAKPDILTFSGDKIFGGPQAGVILGSVELVGAMKRNPLARALRLDKMTLAALIESIAVRLQQGGVLPTTRSLQRSRKEIEQLARDLKRELGATAIPGLKLQIVPSQGRSGGGAAAESNWPSVMLKIELRGCPAIRLARTLRNNKPAVMGLLRQDEFLLDMAGVGDEEIPQLARTLQRVLKKEASQS